MKIIVKDEKEKQELLRFCQYLHDFSVMFFKMRKRSRVEVWENFDGEVKSERIKDFKNICGVGLSFEKFNHLQLLVAMVDAPDNIIPDIIKETIIVEDHKNKYQFKE